MSRHFLYILLILCLPLSLSAQGFKGKTLSVSPHVGLLYVPGFFDFTSTANIDIEKSFNRATSIGISGFSQITDINMSWNRARGSGSNFSVDGFLKGRGYGLYLKRYLVKRGAIAPLGPFFQYGGSVQNYDVYEEDGELLYEGLRTFAIRAAFGFNWFLGKNVLIFGALEGKYEIPASERNAEIISNNEDQFLGGQLEIATLQNLPVAVKLGITIPIL
ncbi:MAG: hypothetical protein AAFQ87_25910 [Bacteroidota bacterium]